MGIVGSYLVSIFRKPINAEYLHLLRISVTAFTESYLLMGLVTESVHAEILGPNFCPFYHLWRGKKRGVRGKKPVCFDTLPRCPRLVCLTITLIRVTCAGSHRLSHLQHSATTTLRLPEGVIQISHRQQSGKISGGRGGGSRTGKLIKHWFALRRSDLMQHERAPRSRRWPEIKDSITAVHACGKGATAEFQNSGLGFPAILNNENESDTCGKTHKEWFFFFSL